MKVALLLIIKDNKVLLFKRNPKDTNNPGKYGLIGGGIEDGETPEEALKREVKEEAGVTINSFKKLKTYKFDKTSIHVFYTNNFNEDEIKLNPEHTSFKYFTADELSNDNIIETNKEFVQDYNDMVKDNKVNEEIKRVKKIMGINESVDPLTVANEEDSVMSIINHKRNIGTITKNGFVPKTMSWDELLMFIKNNGLLLMDIKSNQNGFYIIYRPYAFKQAQELHDLAEKYNGFLSYNASLEDSYRIGYLLEYNEKNIKEYLYKNYPKNKVDYFYSQKDINMTLQEELSKMKSIMGINEDYPTNFNMDDFKQITSFKKRIEYCNTNLKRIGSGSSRAVYQIDDEKVLKLAMNAKGLAQNEHEIKLSNYYDIKDIVANVFDKEAKNLWLEMELARKLTESDFQRISGFRFQDFAAAMENYYNKTLKHIKNTYPVPEDKEITDRMWNEEGFAYNMLCFLGTYELPVGDFLRINSYGIVKRNGADTIVLIDYGISDEIFNKHYEKNKKSWY